MEFHTIVNIFPLIEEEESGKVKKERIKELENKIQDLKRLWRKGGGSVTMKAKRSPEPAATGNIKI